jgi:hypothetical protein
MAFQRGPNIVTNGLILALDAANPKSYVSESTIWYDKSGNGNNGTLTNGPTFDSANLGSIVFDGVDDRVSRNTAIDTGQNFTVSAWIYPTILGTTRRAVVANGYNFSARNGWLFSTAGAGNNNTFFLSIGTDIALCIAPANTLSINTWQNITAVVTSGGETINVYLNGNIINNAAKNTNTGTITYTNPQFNVGFRDINNQQDPYTGNISSVQIYNRALSSEEIEQNYKALKSRYNPE